MMKKHLPKLYLFFLFVLSSTVFAQGMKDYYVNLKNDTVRTKIEGIKSLKYLITKVNGKKIRIPADSIKMLYYFGQIQEPIKTKPKQKAKLLVKYIDGDICLYRVSLYNTDTDGNTYQRELKYVRHKSQPKGYVRKYKRKSDLMEILPSSGRPLMDSILKKSDWSVFLEDIITTYNKRTGSAVK